MKTRAAVLVAIALLAAGAARAQGRYDGRPLPAGVAVDRLVLRKGAHRLEAWSGATLLKTWTVSIGRGGRGPKRYEGDLKTPEGRYRVASKHPSSQFGRFLEISYPNAADRAAFRRGRRTGEVPAGASIGGAVGIHGEKRGLGWLPHKWVDWTRGCVAVDDDEIAELYARVEVGTPVEIGP